MAVEDNPNFKRWDLAFTKLQKRRAFYEAVKDKHPKDHDLVVKTKAAMEMAQAAYEAIVGKL